MKWEANIGTQNVEENTLFNNCLPPSSPECAPATLLKSQKAKAGSGGMKNCLL